MTDFDKPTERRGTSCIKYDSLIETFGREDITPMWVADMDFQTAPPIIDAVKRLAEHGVFGYTFRSQSSIEAFTEWVAKRYQWSIDTGWVGYSPGIVTALPVAIRVYTNPGDSVLIQTPVYPPFHAVVNETGRRLVNNPLILKEGKYMIDFEDFESKLKEGIKLFILCNSHNPIGRVWNREELKRMGELCCKYGTIIFSDDIPSDLALYDNRHTVMASISKEISMNTVTAMAPSKTFNVAGMLNSLIISESEELLGIFNKEIEALHLNLGNIIGHAVMETAYRDCGEWLYQLKGYLEKNIDFTYDFFASELPAVSFIKPESSFLLWLDFTKTGLHHNEIRDRLLNVAKVGLNDGLSFGKEGNCFFRMNIGTQLSVIEEALKRIKEAFV